jgi:glutamyl-tRNA synthetase
MTTRPVRVRYAPSPTGSPHVGNIRTALFNWLYARHSGGKFIVRIEDTDQAREVDNGLELILESLRWLGLDWDEGPYVGGPFGPYRQSDRLPIYKQWAGWLVERGHAYRCYCSAERLAGLRADAQARNAPTGYDRHCRFLTEAERSELAAQGIEPVVRLAVPLEGSVSYHDVIHGQVTFQNAGIDDQVLLKSDGFPTYHLAVVVDDHLMEINPIIRADEWVSSVPKHILLYNAFGWEIPEMVHVPMVLGADRKKLSKRHGATSVVAFREDGYLPDAMVNFLALLGWAYDDKTEIFSREELVRLFSLEKLGHAPGIFSYEKLDWMNGDYIRRLSSDELADRSVPYVERLLGSLNPRQHDQLRDIMPALRERVKKLSEVGPMVDFLFAKGLTYEPGLLQGKGMDMTGVRCDLAAAASTLAGLPGWDAPALESTLRALAEELGHKPSGFFGVLRVAVTGRTVSPPLFETMAVLGRDATLERLERAVALIKR